MHNHRQNIANYFAKALLVLAVIFVGSQAWANTSLEAKKDGVKVLKEANKKGDVIQTLKKGDAVTAKGRKGMYWELEGNKGFVSVTQVKRKKSEDGGMSNAMRELVKQGRDAEDPGNSRARSGVMGVRGLDESSDTDFAGNVKPNLRMVYAMEDINVNDKEVEKLEELVFKEIEKRSGE